MIEYETIINEIKEEIKTYYNEYCRYANLPDEKIDRKIEFVEKLVDKATPLKPIRYNYSNEWHCPSCGSGNGEYEGTVGTHNYCHYCGQKLDWRESK